MQCTPTGVHAGWCAACDGDAPTKCTKCVDGNNGFPMFYDAAGECQFCTSLHEGCTKCRNGNGRCLACDASEGYVLSGWGCKKA